MTARLTIDPTLRRHNRYGPVEPPGWEPTTSRIPPPRRQEILRDGIERAIADPSTSPFT